MSAIVSRLAQLREWIVDTAPAASATAARLRLGSALSGGNAQGTWFGINAGSGYTGDLIRAQTNGADRFGVTGLGDVLADARILYARNVVSRFAGATAAPNVAWWNLKTNDTTTDVLRVYTSADALRFQWLANGQAAFLGVGATLDDYTQDSVRIQPGAGLSTYWRPWGVYLTFSASAPSLWVSREGAFKLVALTTAQKNAVVSPAAGMLVMDTDLGKLCVYTGSAWQTVTSA